MVKRLSFFEEIPSVQRTPDQLVEDIDNLARRIYQQMEDPQGLSHTILELSVKNIPKARQRFLKKIAVSERGCWEWRGALRPKGYGGGFSVEKRFMEPHRWSFLLFRGFLTAGLQLDHLCRVRSCVNPDHLEEVTLLENLRRGFSPAFVNSRKTTCLRGHALSGDNLYAHKGKRNCKTCRREAAKAFRGRQLSGAH